MGDINRKLLIILLPFLLLFLVPPDVNSGQIPLNPPIDITIKRVIDGDTLEVALEDGTVEKVRLLCVNTEESVHPDKKKNTAFGKETSDHVKELLKDSKKSLPGSLEFEDGRRRDRYGRLLCYVFWKNPPGINLNLYLISNGYSPYYTRYGRSKKYHEEFKKAEKEAREGKLGVWGVRWD